MGKLTNKKAIITGGSRGIGKAIALAYAAEGADIAFTYNVQKQEADDVVAAIEKMGRRAIAIQADISSSVDRKKIIDGAVAFLGEINILVNNAGIYARKEYLDISEKDYDSTMTVNVKGAFFLTQLVIKQMMLQNKGGSILNISSFRDRAVSAGLAHYQMSKAALTMFSNSVATEFAKHDIRVNTLSPGMTMTDMTRKTDPAILEENIKSIPLKRAGQTSDLCPMAVLLVSDEGSYMTASRHVIDGGRSMNPMNLSLAAKL